MLVRDYVRPLRQASPSAPLSSVLSALSRGWPVAFPDDEGWRLLRPLATIGLPVSRQLCDVPHEPLETVDIDAVMTTELLRSRGFLGATRSQRLLGAVNCTHVLCDAGERLGEDVSALDLVTRDRLVPRLLHDLANALTIARMGAAGDGATALDHAVAVVHEVRSLYGNLATRPVPIDVPEVIRRMQRMLALAVEPARLLVELAPAPPVMGEPERLERALLNLALNAGEASMGDTVRIAVRYGAGDAALRLAVEDDGHGLDTLPPERSGPRGHGFAAVMRQAALLGGQVQVGRSPFGGASVTLILPVAAVDSAAV